MASSDIIKIGFDYRSSLAQFEKDTNGVFDGISSKAGKQKITIQLDAKDDKVIDKIKELQKLKLDKFTFEFGNSGLKEQLQTFDKLENKINEIINLGKGKSFIDSTPTTSAVGKIEDGINGVSGKVDELKRKTSSGDLFGQKQINQSINSVQKLMSLLSKIKDVNKSTYGNKDNYDWTGLYKTRDEAIQDDLSTKKQNLNSSLALILAEDKNAVSTLESEINNLKSSLESIQNLANRISSNSSISSLDGKSYAEEYKLIDDRLGELNNQYKLTNAELEEYVTLQAKAEKIMDKLMSEAGGVKGSGAKNKSELRSWIEESLASDLGKNSEDIYNGLFGNITDALYNGNGISLFDVDGIKRNLREIAADILKYKSDFSDMTGSFGAKEDFSKLNELKSILSYINKNSDAINNFDFKEQIEAQKRLIKSLESNGASDSLLADEKKQLEELISLQERLDNARNGATNDNAISQQNKLQEELKETESQAEKTNDALNNSSTSNDSQIEELKSDIAEVKTELSEVKEKISGIDSEGLENVRNDVEKTKESVQELNSELTEMKSKLDSSTVNESNISSGRKDAFPNADTKLDEAVTSAKDLDKTLEQVDMPTDSFDKVLEKLDRTKSELVDIVKITKQSVSDAEGKFHDSYTLKDSRGSTEIYGMNSKTDKGQILRQNIVGYDSKKDSVDESKELLAVERQVTSEINAQTKAQQKKWQAFSKEQSDYEKSVNETNSAIQKTDELLDKLPLHDKLDAQFIDVLDSVDKLNSKLKLGEISLSEYKNEVKTITSEYSKLVNIQNKADESASKQQAKDIQTEWDKNIKAIQNYMDAVTKLNNLKAKDKGTGSEANQIALQTQNVEELKQTALEARKNLSSMQAENPDIIIWKQWVDMMELFDQASKGSAESAAKLKDVLDNIKVPSLDKYENKLSSYQAKTGGYDATIARFKDGGWTSPEYLKNVQAVEAAVKKYEDLLSNIKAKGGIASEKDVQTLKEYEGEIKKTISTVTNMSAAEKGYNFVSGQKELDKIHKLLNENSKMSSDAKAKIRAYYREIESGNPSMSLDRIHGEIMKIYNAEVEAGRAGRTFLDTLKNSGFHQFAAQMAGMFSFYDIINVARQGINTIRELDEAMTEVRKVSEATESQYSSFQQTVASTAKEIASTNKELLNSSADFLRLGYDLNQAEDLAKNATLFVNVGDGVDITAATEDMITAMKAFDIQAEDSIKIVDDYNQIGNMYALSATDIGEAMKRSASALETGNNSFEQSIGLITAMNEIVQNSENTGNTLKVLSLRLRGAKAELESMSEDTDGLCDSTSKLREQIQALTGVDIMLDDNTFKSTADIIKELGAVWNNLTDSSQAATLEIIAGKTRANNVAALLKNYQQIDNVISDLGDAQGSAARENAAIIDSINGRIKILSASAEEFWQTVINKDAVKNAVTFASDLLGVLSKVIDKIGVLPTLLTGVGAGLSLKNIGKCYVSA